MTDYPNGISSMGIPVLSPLSLLTGGNIFYVNSVSGSDGADGKTTAKALASIDYAVGLCTASNGDKIIVLPGHVETVTAAAGLAIDVAGVEIYGLGRGSLRPTINFTTVVGASMVVSAANCSMDNVLFTGGIDALTNPVHVQAADFTLSNFETRDVTGQTTDFIVTTADADRFKMLEWKHAGATAAGAATAVSIVGGDSIEISNFDIDGNFSVSAIENVTTASTNLKIGAYGTRRSLARTRNAADVIATLVATSTGFVGNIFARLQDNAANVTEAFVGADMQFGNDIIIVNADGEQALPWNGAASTDA